MRAVHLKTEYLRQPIGIDMVSPRFYWNCEEGKKQTAYRIVVKSDQKILWDSGKVESDSSIHIQYQGRALKSRERAEWSVQLWDENGAAGKTESSWFEIGLLEEADWSAKWIAGDYRPKKNERYPVDCFCREFSCGKPVKKARLYITACGLYEAKINGKRVGKMQLAPGSTDYRKRIQYQTYDVTEFLSSENKMEVELADGWYRGSVGCFGFTNVFGRQTALLAQLELVYEDGTKERIGTDTDWKWSNDGAIRFADLKDGEIVDASMHTAYGKKAILADKAKVPCPTASDNVMPVIKEQFKPKLLSTASGKTVLDFGQNLAGFLQFQVKGKKGTKIHILLGEILDEQGEFTQKNMQEQKPVREIGKLNTMLLITGNTAKIHGEKQPTPKQEIQFICSGEEDFYQTKFAVFGFRYALVETKLAIVPEQFTALAVYSDMEQTGEFSCSNMKVNQLFSNTMWSMKSNFLDVPTDCPTRERLAWTGDAQIFFKTASYLMDTASFYRKWMKDLCDGQFANGKISAVVPYSGASMLYDNTGGSVGWGDCAVLLPYRFWKWYQDDAALEQFYPLMRGYAMFMIDNCGYKKKCMEKQNPYHKYVYEKGVQLGEWLEPEEFQDKIGAGMKDLHTEEATAYLSYTMEHMKEAAKALGKTADAKLFDEYAIGAKNAYRYMFLDRQIPDTDRQAKLVRPLAFDLPTEEQRTTLERRLEQAVERREYRIATGFLSTPFILDVLTKAGRADLAYRMLENEKAPGWLYEVDQGATTIWENWEGTVSHNHYSPGTVCKWMFDTICGIRSNRENHFLICPIPGGSFAYAKASWHSMYGTVTSGWTKEDGGIRYTIEIPPNCTAEVKLPSGEKRQLEAGRYEL